MSVAEPEGVEWEAEDIDYLGEPSVPKEEWPDICKRTLEYREDHRNYIQQCKEWLGVNSGGSA